MKKAVQLLFWVLFIPLTIVSTCSRTPHKSVMQRQIASTAADQKNPVTPTNNLFSITKLNVNYNKLFGINKEEQENSLTDSVTTSSDGTESNKDLLVPAGTEFIAIVNNDCVRTKNENFSGEPYLSQSIANSNGMLETMSEQVFPIQVDNDSSLEDLAQEIDNDPCIIGAAENGEVKISQFNDPMFSEQNHHRYLGTKESRFFSFDSSLPLTHTVKIAVLDTGADLNHPDLKPNFIYQAGQVLGKDFINEDSDPSDDHGHGSHVAGIIGASSNNGLGVTGVLSGKVQLIPVKVLNDQGAGDYGALANGIKWAVENGAEVINISINGTGKNAVLEDTLRRAAKKAVIIASAGNDGELINSDFFPTPGAYTRGLGGMVNVGSIDSKSGDISYFSNYSNRYVDILAPGSESSSRNAGILSTHLNGSYKRLSGTSMAAPMVSAAAGLAVSFFKSYNISYSPRDIEELLEDASYKDPFLNEHAKDGNVLRMQLLDRYLYKKYLIMSEGGLRNDL